MEQLDSIQDLERLQQSLRLGVDPQRLVVNVCVDTGCNALGAERIFRAMEQELANRDLIGSVDLKPVGCPGFCQRGPVIVINPYDIFYQQVEEQDVTDIVDQTLLRFNILGRLLYPDPRTGRRYVYGKENPFYRKQMRLVMGDNGLIDPTRIQDYLARGGYSAAARVLSAMTPDEVIDQVEKAGLRGRGGAGFPTGAKWRFCHRSSGEIKYIICNADEGDPGAFMDRTVLEGNPHLVLEGMIIGGYAMGARHGFIYVRAEYPTAIRHMEIALDQCRQLGLLGRNILGRGFDFDIRIKVGAGAFVCGEETALMQSIEGKRGMPPAQAALPRSIRIVGVPDQHQQCRDLGQHPWHHRAWLGVVCRHRHRNQQGHQNLLPERPHQQHRPGGGADGDHPAGGDRRNRRRYSQGPEFQGGANGRSLRRGDSGAVSGFADRLRIPQIRGFDDGIGRNDHPGRKHLPGRSGPILSDLHPE